MAHLRLLPPDGGLKHRLLARCHFPPPGTAVDCAVSGGPDSLALLALAVAAGCEVTAWHVDHGLREGSHVEADVVEQVAKDYGAGMRRVTLDIGWGPNLEDRARRARFGALPEGVLTGHTADDQAETVLLALVRGAGIDGLSGMGLAKHPILELRRAETVALCADEGLTPIADPSNDDEAIRRNRIRHELLPLACEIAGRDIIPLLVRSAELMRADADVLGALSEEVDATDAKALARAPIAVARRAVRKWLTDAVPPYPPSAAAVERVLAVARGEALACEVAGVGRIARHHQRLVIEV
ncbi:MAG: tRNA lysidine(34) synthetase TilS [Acidimicrobiales bacterium]